MRHFRNILVGVDLARAGPSGTPELGPDNQEAVRRSVWLARQNSARLLFFSALNLSEKALHKLTEDDRSHLSRTVEEAVRAALADLVRKATDVGVDADGLLVPGRGWLEIIRQVLREKHDLVVMGARHLHGLRRVVFGSTAMNLVRKCPSAVWVAKAWSDARPLRVLVASDLTPVGDEALRLALALKEMSEAEVHVLHAVEFPLDLHWSTGLPDAATEAYHNRLRAEALHELEAQLERASEGRPTTGVSLHLADRVALPDAAILDFIQRHHVDLLVIGTIARGGIPGLVVGNTAERLLPEVPCSLLAVKPADFHCPVHLE